MRDLLLQPLLLLHRIKGFFHSSFQGFYFLPQYCLLSSLTFRLNCYFNMASCKLKVEIDRKNLCLKKILLWIRKI